LSGDRVYRNTHNSSTPQTSCAGYDPGIEQGNLEGENLDLEAGVHIRTSE